MAKLDATELSNSNNASLISLSNMWSQPGIVMQDDFVTIAGYLRMFLN